MHIHHAYIGLALMVLSLLAILSKFSILIDYNFWVAFGFFVLGVIVFLHDMFWHLTHRKKR